MSSADVTVVVKSASLRHADMPVTCGSSWTVAQLKLHINEHHPSKPLTVNQRLIYSGHQLTDDSALLTHVLRQPELAQSAETSAAAAAVSRHYTVHLVCSLPAANRQEMSSSTTTEAEGGLSSSERTDNTDGVRRRAAVSSESAAASVLFGQPPGGLFGPPPANLAALSSYQQQQMAAAYTLYAQYWTQYTQALQSGTLSAPTLHTTPNSPSTLPPQSPVPGAAPAEVPPDQAHRRLQAEGAGGEQPEMVQWDWLDWLHALTRIALLLCTVVVYSTGARLIFIAFCVVAVYFYNEWLSRSRRAAVPPAAAANNNNNQQQHPPAGEVGLAAAAAAGGGGGARSGQEQEPGDVAAAAAADRVPGEQRLRGDLNGVQMDWSEQRIQQANPASVTWNIICSFFSSLFPGVEAGHI